MGDSNVDLLETAVHVAKGAGKILVDHLSETRQVHYKGGIDLVTDADRLSETYVLDHLRKAYPKHAILSEEAGAVVKGVDGHRWVVDPLDGTTNYAHRLPHFSVSIAVELKGKVQVGVVYDPMRDELFAAARGHGATLNGARIRPSSATELMRSLMCTGFPYDVHQRPENPVGLLSHMLTRVQGVRRMGSAALDLAYVACGRLDGYFEFSLKPWDVAAGALLVEESGAVIAALDGKPWTLAHADVLACAPGIGAALKTETQAFLLRAKGAGHI